MTETIVKICIFAGCDRPHYGLGYCNAHWQQFKRGEVTEIRRKPRTDRLCSFEGCGRELSYADLCQSHGKMRKAGEELRPIRTVNRYNGAECRVGPCGLTAMLGGLCVNHKYAHRFGLSDETLTTLFSDPRCHICHRTENGKRWMHIDHDHACKDGTCEGCEKCIRGLLCHGCNHGLGNFKDDPDTLNSAIEYLLRWDERKTL